MYELKKHDPHNKKSIIAEVQGQMCQRHVSRENLTHVTRNLPRWRRKAKYA
ncbi:hypothetical protein BHE74_00025444 [Ensete ventricosum]|uniref:Uncharacterized protein n=1 Tax=Ensete ventricosum TaxID=4639 RepID=A0A426ZGM6_ENSVE|nr:hypothetical protein B296_00032037 [Ensete ventricosum]RWW08431.1 hypothetical protein GW17_00028135 [Ensete ventricosum]RWW67133.1 hypothetical protein BHE74_00025444 [Ensete ventricosum]RZS07213.1 hypothetical protein BHM03_00038011 [Ensete ventricosum]